MRRRMPRLVLLSRRTSVAKFASCRACAEQVGRCYSIYSRSTTNEPSASRRTRPVCKQSTCEQTPWIGDRVLSCELRRFIHLTQPRRSSHSKSNSQSSIADSEHAGAAGEQEDDSRAPGEAPTKPTKPVSAAKPNLSSKMRRKEITTDKKFAPVLLPPDLHKISLHADATFFSERADQPAVAADETIDLERADATFFSEEVEQPVVAADETHNPKRADATFFSEWIDPPDVAADEKPQVDERGPETNQSAVENHGENHDENHDKNNDENYDKDRDPEVQPESPTPTEDQKLTLIRNQFMPTIKRYLRDFESYLASAMPTFVPIPDELPKPKGQQGKLPSVEVMGSEPHPTDRRQSQRVKRRDKSLLGHEDENASPEATSQPSLKEMIYSFFSLYVDNPKFPELGRKPQTMLDSQLLMTRFRLHLSRWKLRQAEVANIARYLFQTDDLEPGMVADLFKHMYRHRMYADIIRFGLRTMEIWAAAEATSLFILHKTRLPDVAMAIMFRTCVDLHQHQFARQILAEAYTDPAFADIFGVENGEELTVLEKKLFLQAHLENSIVNATNPEALSALVNSSEMGDLIRRSEETTKLVISRLLKLGDANSAVDIVVNSVFRNPHFIFYAMEIAVEEGAELSWRLDDILSSGVAQLLAADRTFDSLRFVVDLVDRSNAMEVWSFLATGSRTAITRSEDVDQEVCTNYERLSKRLVRAFLNRAIEFGDATLFLRVLQTKMPELVHIRIAPGHTADMFEILLKRTYASDVSVMTEQRTVNLMAALLSAQTASAASESFQRLLVRIQKKREITEERKSQYVFAMLSALAKVPRLEMSEKFWEVMVPIILNGSENLRTAVLMRFQDTVGLDIARKVLHDHLDTHRETATYDHLLLFGYLTSPLFAEKPSGDLPEKQLSAIKQTILSMLSNHNVTDESEFPEIALRTTEEIPAEIIDTRGVEVERLVDTLHETYDLPESFFQWYLQAMMYYHQFEIVFKTIQAGHEQLMQVEGEETPKVSKVRLNTVHQSFLEELQFRALRGRQPYWALYGRRVEIFMFDQALPGHNEKLIRLAFRLLESETKSGVEGTDFELRTHCATLIGVIRKGRIDIWRDRVTTIFEQGLQLIRIDERNSPFIGPSAMMMVSERRLTEALKTIVAAADADYDLPIILWIEYLWRMRRILRYRARGRHIYLIIEARYSELLRLIKHYVRLHDWWGTELKLIRAGPEVWLHHRTRNRVIKSDNDLLKAFSERGYYTKSNIKRSVKQVREGRIKLKKKQAAFMQKLKARGPFSWLTGNPVEVSESASLQPALPDEASDSVSLKPALPDAVSKSAYLQPALPDEVSESAALPPVKREHRKFKKKGRKKRKSAPATGGSASGTDSAA